MADERDRERDGVGDAPRHLEGLGKDAAHAHGEAAGAAQGGSVGRRTMGNASDDLLGIDVSTREAAGAAENADDATAHQREAGMRRHGLEGKGFDGGGGYGGGGNDSLYSSESSYGGHAGGRDSSMRGAYAGDDYGRQGEQAPGGGAAAGQGSSPRDVDLPRGTDEQADDAARRRGTQGGADDDRDTVDLDTQPDVSRREPTR